MSSPQEDAPPASVVAAVLGTDAADLSTTLAALRRQVYGVARIVVIGSDNEARLIAAEQEVHWNKSSHELLDQLDTGLTHVWFLREGAVPAPDALRSLLLESERVDASLAGSKLVDAGSPELLLAVGVATDIFDAPYLGLDADEMDHGQYDVVRDVAAVAGASMLIRRDLALGLDGPDPALPPEAAGIDLCQRARIRGARVVVIPSSVVAYPRDRLLQRSWREEAGEIRAMLKVYSLLTLVWTIPLRFVVGLLETLIAPFLGRWTLGVWVRSWVWNLGMLYGTVGLRSVARRGRAAGDEELFRFQARGSTRLRELWIIAIDRFRRRFQGQEDSAMAALGRDLRQPALVTALLAILFAALATRALWAGFPAARYSLPLPSSGADAVGAFAGGWNPAGLGSPESLHPFIAMGGLVQMLLFDRPDIAAGAMLVISMILGIWGTTRLLRLWGMDTIPGVMGGVALVAGPATRGIAGDGAIPTLVAVGLLPWAVFVMVAPLKRTWWAYVSRGAGLAWLVALLGYASPLLVPVPLTLVTVWAVLHLRDGAVWRSVLVGLAATVVGALALFPWLDGASLEGFVTEGIAYWEPGIIMFGAIGLALLAGVLAAPSGLLRVAVWAGLACGGGAVAARSAVIGSGREVEAAALAVVGLGTAAIVGVVFESLQRVEAVRGWSRAAVAIGAVGAAAVVLSAALVLPAGRAGLPGDVLTDATNFISASDGELAPSRTLLVGPPDTLPGDARFVRGAAYRVASAPVPQLWEAWLPEARSGDAELDLALASIIDAETFRAGETLAPFGIRWVIVMGDTPLEAVFRGQLDLLPLPGLARPTFISDADGAVRALAAGGGAWEPTSWGYRGPSQTSAVVRLAENADAGWGPQPWAADGWANTVSAETGEARYSPDPGRQTASRVVAGGLVGLVALSWWGRRKA